MTFLQENEVRVFKDCILCGSRNCQTLYPSTNNEINIDPLKYACTSIGHRQYGQIVKCNNCSLIYINPRLNDKEIIDSYIKVVDNKYLRESECRKMTFERVLKLIKSYKDKGKILDIGCNIGTFLEAARSDGWETFGVELSQWAASYAKKILRLNVLEGTIEESAKFATKFDVITLWDTIEHMTDPLYELKSARKLLKNDGFLLLSTMNIDSHFARMLGKWWPWLMDMHLYYFTPKTIKLLLEKAGLQLKEISSYSHVISLDYLAYKVSAYSKWLSDIINKVLNSLRMNRIPININFGDFMTVIAQKKDD